MSKTERKIENAPGARVLRDDELDAVSGGDKNEVCYDLVLRRPLDPVGPVRLS